MTHATEADDAEGFALEFAALDALPTVALLVALGLEEAAFEAEHRAQHLLADGFGVDPGGVRECDACFCKRVLRVVVDAGRERLDPFELPILDRLSVETTGHQCVGPVEEFVNRVIESSLPTSAEEPHFSYYLPTKLSPWLGMSALTVAVGGVAYPFYDSIRDALREVRDADPLRPNWYYDGATEWVDANDVGDLVHNGLLRTYALWFLGGASLLTLGGYAAAAVGVPAFTSFAVTPAIGIVLVVAIVGAAAVTDAPSHVAGVLTLSILGFMVAIFYILADAPDLALTQLVIETLVLLIFLLVLDKLPAFYGDSERWTTIRDAGASLLVGGTVAVTVLLSTASSPGIPSYLEHSLKSFFIERAPPPAEHGSFLLDSGGGHNIVNVILVDFRAFDTLGEISVVAMAALSIVTLIAMRERGETQ